MDVPLHKFLSSLLVAFFLLHSPLGTASTEDSAPPPSPSVGRDIHVRVDRGASVELLLKGVAMPGETVQFAVAKDPAHGSLSGPRRLAKDAVAYTYTHDNSKNSELDKAVFRLKTGPGNAWGRITAEIDVQEPASKLALDTELLDFGPVPIGETRVRNLRVQNQGGGVLRGSLRLGSPWSVEGPAEFATAEGEDQVFRIAFSPSAPDEHRGRLSIDAGPDSTFVSLRGEGTYRFDVPGRIVLNSTPAGSFVDVPVANLAERALELEIEARPPLVCTSALRIPPGGHATLKVGLENKHYTEKFAEFLILDGKAVRSVRVDLPPPPALLQWTSRGDPVDLGEFPLRHTARSGFELQNRGATSAEVELRDGSGGLFLDADQPRSFQLQPGESAEVRTVWRLPEEPGEFFSEIVAAHGGLEHPLRLRAWVLAPPPPQEGPADRNATVSPTPEPDRVLNAAEREELQRRTPRDIAYRLIPGANSAGAIVSWKFSGSEPVEFRLERKVVQRARAGLEQSLQERLQVPDELPAPQTLVKWISATDESRPVSQTEAGHWEGVARGLEPGFHELRIATRAPPDGRRIDYSSFMVEVDPLPPNPLWKWIAAALGILCMLYLLRKPVRRLLGQETQTRAGP